MSAGNTYNTQLRCESDMAEKPPCNCVGCMSTVCIQYKVHGSTYVVGTVCLSHDVPPQAHRHTGRQGRLRLRVFVLLFCCCRCCFVVVVFFSALLRGTVAR